MSTVTANYNITKPDPSEYYSVDVVNANSDIIDGQMKVNSDAIAAEAQTARIAEAQIRSAILNLFPIGSVVLRVDTVNPGDVYGGTWSRLEGGSLTALGGPLVKAGELSGSNAVSIPLVEHAHTATLHGQTNEHAHNHSTNTPNEYALNDIRGKGLSSSTDHNLRGKHAQTSDATHHHTVEVSGNTSSVGTPSPVISVAGQILTLNVWNRVA